MAEIIIAGEAGFRGSNTIKQVIQPGQTLPVFQTGNFYYLTESDYLLEIKTDLSSFKTHDVGTGESFPDYIDKEGRTVKVAFNNLEIRNPNTVACEFELFVGFSTYIDNRLNVVERRNGSAASTVPPVCDDEQILTFGAGNANTYVKLLDANPNRSHVWLYTDEADNLAYFAPRDAQASANATADFRRVGMEADGFTKLVYKGEIWVRAENGVTVGALEFTF